MKHSLYAIGLLSVLSITSCDKECPELQGPCHCHDNGNTIGGWDEKKDTVDFNKKDPEGGFSISLDNWSDADTTDVHI